MAYRHGVYVNEMESSQVAPASAAAGLQVVVGTAPVHLLEKPEEAVNTPILVQNMAEATKAVGYSADWGKYTICNAMYASFTLMGVGPLVLINVLDPKKHTTEMSEKQVSVKDGQATVEQEGLLLAGLAVKNGGAAMTRGEDYLAGRDENGNVVLTMIAEGKGASAETLTVSGKILDASKVTAEDIVGGLDMATGRETGLEAVRQVFPKFGMNPGLLIAPRWSMEPTVAAAMQGKVVGMNSVFRCQCIVDLDDREGTGARTYQKGKEKKEAQGLSSTRCMAVWGCGKIGEQVCSGSALAAALQACTDNERGDIPYVSPSNKTLTMGGMCLSDGTQVLLDQDQANTLNSWGIATWLNMNGWRLWGNRTAAYPGKTGPKDSFFACRRYMDWRANSFILTYFQKVDDPMNKRLIESVVDSENVRGNGYVAIGAAAGDRIEYRAEENTAADLLNGKLTFHQYVTPFPPAEVIEDNVEFDPTALAGALA